MYRIETAPRHTIQLVGAPYCNITTPHTTDTTRGPFLLTGINLLDWISSYIHYKAWGEMTYPFSDFNDCTVKIGMDE